MKKHYFFKSVFLLFFSMLGLMAVKGQVNYALEEGFEDGTFPKDWSQEHEVGNTKWIVEQGGSFPNGAAEGSWRIALRNSTDQTQGFVTRLITPPMDISPSKVGQPVLIFSHAQNHYLTDVDELRIYFRRTPSDEWRLLEKGVYTDPIRNWQYEMIELPNPTSTYQIAFEGTDKYGRGIVLDDVKVRPLPVCDPPESLIIYDATSSSFNLYWNGDVDTYYVRVSKSTSPEIESDVVLDTVVNQLFCPVNRLEVNQTYHCFVKADCGEEQSEWFGPVSHTTTAIISDIPYEQYFNVPYKNGYSSQNDTWIWGNSMESLHSPHINSQTAEGNRNRYSQTATTCVVFAASTDVNDPIPGGQSAYIASPEIADKFDLKALQVSFTATAYTHVDSRYAASLIVGVMTDPLNVNSFTPVDTVSIKLANIFESFTIPLDKYNGEGRYIAFVSKFSKNNIFYLDDVRIDSIPDCQTVNGVRVKNTTPTSTQIVWNNAVTASSYKVVVTAKAFTDPSQANGDDLKYQEEVQTNSCQIPASTLTKNTKYYVYVQGVCQKGDMTWSKECTFQTPCEETLDLDYTFETADSGMDCLYANSYLTLPSLVNNNALEGQNALYIQGKPHSKAYVSFPTISDFTDVWMTFFAKASSAANVGTGSKIEVGVMTDINDYNTFVSLETITAGEEYQHFNVNFIKYTGQGKNIAIMLSSENNATTDCGIYIDNVKIEKIPECNYPLDITVVPGETSAKFTWNSSGEGNRYQIKISGTSIKNNIETGESVINEEVNTNSFETTIQLLPNKTLYYYYVRSLCGSTEKSDWTYEGTFETLCLEKNQLPYEEDFESFAGGVSRQEIPVCWGTVFTPDGGTYYPHIANNEGYGSSKSLYLSASAAHADYVALPGMNSNSVRNLQLSFMVKLGGNDTLKVGVVSDLTDISTFIQVKEITSTMETQGKWQEIIMTFENHQGSEKYITFYTPGGTNNAAYIDNIKVNTIQSCLKPQNLRATDIRTTTAKLYWDNVRNESKWRLMVLDRNDVAPEAAVDEIIFNEIIENNPYQLPAELLAPNTHYFYYLQSICGNGDTETTDWTLNYGTFKTLCGSKTAGAMGIETFEDNATGFDCWVTGLAQGNEKPPVIISDNGSKRLRISNTANTFGAYAIMPEIDITDVAMLQVSFDMYSTAIAGSNQKSIEVGIVTDASDLNTYMKIETVTAESLNKYNERFTVRFDEYEGDWYGGYGKKVMFRSPYGLEENTNEIFIDNIKIDTISSCAEPTKIEGEYVGDDLYLEWNGEEQGEYRVVISKISLSESELNAIVPGNVNIVEDKNVTGKSTSIELEETLSSCYIYIQKICSPKNGPWSNEYHFTIKCQDSYPVPYVENFENYSDGIAPFCWTSHYGYKGEASLNTYPKFATSANKSLEGTSLYIYTENKYETKPAVRDYYCMAVSPALQVDGDISNYQLSFDVSQVTSITNYPRLIVGLTDNPNVLNLDSAFYEIAEICIPAQKSGAGLNQWFSYTFDLSSLANKGDTTSYNHLVFAVDRGRNRSTATSTTKVAGGFYLDNISLELIPECLKPARIIISDISDTFIEVSWKELGSAQAWKVQHGTEGFQLGSGTIVNVNDSVFKITGLTANTSYDVYIQSVCGGNESEWTGPYTIRTLLECKTTPYTYGFEDTEENKLWQMINDESFLNRWHIGNAINNGGSNSLYITNNGGDSAKYTIAGTSPTFATSAAWAVSPHAFKLPGTGIYRVSFDWNCVGETSDYIRAALVPAFNSYTTVPVASSYAAAQGIVIEPDGTWITLTANAAGPKYWLGLEEENYKLFNNNGWKTRTVDILITDTMPEYYKLVFFWINNNSAGDRPSPSAVIDNIRIDHHACPVPLDIQVENITYNSAKIVWKSTLPIQEKYSIKVLKERVPVDQVSSVSSDLIAYEDNNIATTYCQTTDVLEGSTTYYYYVSSNCSGGATSIWIEDSLKTYCPPTDPLVTKKLYTFNDEEEKTAPDCWVVGVNGTSTYMPGVYANNNKTRIFSRGNEFSGNNSFRINTTKDLNNNNGAYVILPPVEGDSAYVAGLQLRFYARGYLYHHFDNFIENQGYKISIYGNGGTGRITVGTTATQDDISTFREIKTVQLSTITDNMRAHEKNNWLFDEIVIPLDGTHGRFIALKSEYNIANTVHIDDLIIEEATSSCMHPKQPTVANITSSSATISWQRGNDDDGTTEDVKWMIRVAKDAGLTEVEKDITVTDVTPLVINDLSPNTTYYIAVKKLCGEFNESRWSPAKDPFITNDVVPFIEPFTTLISCPEGWRRYGHFDRAFGNEIGIGSMRESNVDNSSMIAWSRADGPAGFPTSHMKRAMSNTNQLVRSWLMTPIIELPANEETWLNFDVALTAYDSPDPIASKEILLEENDRFMVVISEDSGNTWKIANATIWDNQQGSGNYVYNDIPSTGQNVSIDLAKYKGKNIRVGFYVESAQTEPLADIHLDNVYINRKISESHEETICEGRDFIMHGFDIPYYDLKVGETTDYLRTRFSTDPAVLDSIVTLKLTVNKMPTKTFYGSICEGGTYQNEGNDFVAQNPGIYKRKITASSPDACDSIAILNLSVATPERDFLNPDICHGTSFTFNKKEYKNAGQFKDTIRSVVTGCDSIITSIDLTIREIIRDTIWKTICYQETYPFNGNDYGESGTYEHETKTAEGCDSVSTLVLHVKPELISTFYVYTCAGKPYTGYGFKGVPAVNGRVEERKELTPVGKCDSIIRIDLTVIEDITRREKTINISELPIDFLGKHYDKSYTVGTHKDTVPISLEDCEGTLIRTLIIEDGTGLSSNQYDLLIVPTIIERGQSVQVNFGGNSPNGLQIEVYDTTGRTVYRETSNAELVEVKAFPNTGMYLIKATSSQGDVKYGRVIVK